MTEIRGVKIIARGRQYDFLQDLKAELAAGQNEGLEAEVQFSATVDFYSALVIWR